MLLTIIAHFMAFKYDVFFKILIIVYDYHFECYYYFYDYYQSGIEECAKWVVVD